MKRTILAAVILAGSISATASADDRLVLNFNPGWKFLKADPAVAQLPDFNDDPWTTVSTPHTFNEVDTFNNLALPGMRGEQNQWSGRTWYRKTFSAPDAWKDKKVYIQFDAIRQVGEVYLNGRLLGTAKNGFLPFGFDLTPHLRIGKPNVLAVMCDNRFMFNPLQADAGTAAKPKGKGKAKGKKQDSTAAAGGTTIENLQARLAKEAAAIPENVADLQANQVPWNNPQWHPPMGGIYRDVKLILTDPLHISLPLYDFLQTAGPYVYATDISRKSATVNVEVPYQNGRSSSEEVEVAVQVLDCNGKPIFDDKLSPVVKVAAGASGKTAVSFVIQDPNLWEPDYPYLYRAVIQLKSRRQTVDSPADSLRHPRGALGHQDRLFHQR